MQEIVTDAIVLDREPAGESDARLFLYTRARGSIAVRAIGARKIVSKLSSHLEPGSSIRCRLVGNGGFHLADALVSRRLPLTIERVRLFQFLRTVLLPNDFDECLWELLEQEPPAHFRSVLSCIGFDPEHAHCFFCGAGKPPLLATNDPRFFCV